MVLLPDVPAIVLNLPIILTIIAVSRYVIGFKAWKNYPVLALSLAYYLFFQLLESTWVALLFWALFVIIIIGSAITTRFLIRRLKINYYARIAVMYLIATIAALFAIAVIGNTSLGTLVTDPLFGIAIFLVGTAIDELATLLFKKDLQEFLRRLISTVGISLLSGLIITWAWWNGVITVHHEILVVVLIADLIVAFWTAIRFTELIRFSSIIKNQR
ncbi:hypothetical protein COZ14_03065 [Candidatus Dojkabacteria bacterium CG_4_10_14_3_um_filter_Dojkabacteria_WS6_41_9]|uniref:7 transmembrane helices usually fused to an inactive transglutaminase domain-containing protein n=1 Tax=Candidatus Dojkabacteria bacterium CG_4_10_14_0_2_um_filter_Dojkabacteria_WS6_41_15 TaxID=2014249 RepID=A0A2M7W0G6_9BACT|nr:MAG: hypothetical protein COZ14_03065 [Candidatus Dojkabacteria bacterium CG_4_10_14_3_um_filter_Dojkabacteria_WS6_41_9]PJA11937.1 MAG: hypothetical protein COX64_05205 [Candidatus Dojkabacteria bacterium CG_4_10_14_0_2_um_filter_Dojkabacteria_WS6_41_15]